MARLATQLSVPSATPSQPGGGVMKPLLPLGTETQPETYSATDVVILRCPTGEVKGFIIRRGRSRARSWRLSSRTPETSKDLRCKPGGFVWGSVIASPDDPAG